MKKLRKLLAVLVTVAMAIGMLSMSALAAEPESGTITIVPPTNTPDGTTNTYKIYKVFDAHGNGTNISYTLPTGKTLSKEMATYFDVDSVRNVTAKNEAKDDENGLTTGAINAIKAYVTESDLVDAATSTGKKSAVSKSLPDGFYYIATSTGTAVTIDSINTANVEVFDKNNVPSVDKTITGVNDGSYDENGKTALAQVGTHVSYKSEINVPGNTKNLKFKDTPGTGLSLDTDSLKVQVNKKDVATDNYTSTITTTGIDITFTDDFIAGLEANTKIDVTYTATITDDALTTFTDAGRNTASISYGDNNATVTDEQKPVIVNATVRVNKIFQGLDKDASLQNDDSAQFVLTKTVDGATKYYSINNKVVTWVDSPDSAFKVTIKQNGTGDGAFTGLADGNYTLVESKVPAGYNKANPVPVTIEKGNYEATNLSQTKDIENRTGSALPTTGGMGTTIFYVLGAAFVIGAGIVLVTRRKLSK